MRRRCRPLVDRFWEHVDKNGPIHPRLGTRCWIWTGDRLPRGYGYISRGRRSEGKVYAHRLSYTLAGGLPGEVVAHACDNPPCVNPTHLFTGTTLDNVRDKITKGRGANPRGLLTHCLSGRHEFTASNTQRDKRGRRSCKACARERHRQRKHPHEAVA